MPTLTELPALVALRRAWALPIWLLAAASCASLGTYDGPTSTCLKLQAPAGITCDGPPRAFRTGEVCTGDLERVVLENCRQGGEKPATVYMPVKRMDCQVKEAPGGLCLR